MRLRVMTYNIHRAIGIDRRFRPERIVRVIDHHAPDIVLLQEVDEGAPRSREVDLARELAVMAEYPHYAVGHNVTLRKGRYGNATLSRFPILRERNIDLTIGGRKRRGCQHTRIRIQSPRAKERELDVFNLHLGLSARERTRQVGMLVRSGEYRDLDVDAACLVGGDFNDWRAMLHPIFVDILGFRCATERTGRQATMLTYPSFSPRGGLDRVYHRGPVRATGAHTCRLNVSRVASDHLPVITDLELH